MDQQNNPDAAYLARARALLAAAAIGVERLERAANLAFFRVAALTEALARLEGPGGPRKPEAGEAAAPDAATLCREAEALLRDVRSRRRPPRRVVGTGGRRGRSPARAGGAASGRGL